jgi:hypothetical protein
MYLMKNHQKAPNGCRINQKNLFIDNELKQQITSWKIDNPQWDKI